MTMRAVRVSPNQRCDGHGKAKRVAELTEYMNQMAAPRADDILSAQCCLPYAVCNWAGENAN